MNSKGPKMVVTRHFTLSLLFPFHNVKCSQATWDILPFHLQLT